MLDAAIETGLRIIYPTLTVLLRRDIFGAGAVLPPLRPVEDVELTVPATGIGEVLQVADGDVMVTAGFVGHRAPRGSTSVASQAGNSGRYRASGRGLGNQSAKCQAQIVSLLGRERAPEDLPAFGKQLLIGVRNDPSGLIERSRQIGWQNT